MKRAPDSGSAQVRACIAGQPAVTGKAIRELRRIIRAAAPGAKDAISYKIPAFRLNERILVWYAGWRNHSSMYPVTPALLRAHKIDVKGHETSKGTIRFPLDRRLPVGLIKRLVKARMAELFCVSLFAFLVVSQATAQANPPCAGKPFTRIAVLEGRWSVNWNNRVAPGQYERSAARSQIESVIPRCALLERFTGSVQGNPFWGTALLTVSASDTARRVWIDSGHGEPLLFDGGWVGDTLALNWSHDLGSRVLRLRHLYFDIRPGSFRTATYLSTATGSPWELVGEASYQRERP